MLSRSGWRMFTAALVAFLLAGLQAFSEAAHSSDWAPYFMDGMMAGHVLSNFAAQKWAQTEALQSMAYGGGGGFDRRNAL